MSCPIAGAIDTIGTAQSVLQDWNAGKIPFFTLPPAREVHAEEEGSEAIVPSWGAEFGFDEGTAPELGGMDVVHDESAFVRFDHDSSATHDGGAGLEL